MYILGMPQVPVLGPIQDSYQVDVFYVCVNWQDVDLGRKNNTKKHSVFSSEVLYNLETEACRMWA